MTLKVTEVAEVNSFEVTVKLVIYVVVPKNVVKEQFLENSL